MHANPTQKISEPSVIQPSSLLQQALSLASFDLVAAPLLERPPSTKQAAAAMAARALAVVALMAAVFGMASAATYNVGEPGGSWDLETNYANWVANKRFLPGDEIVFKYSPQAHDVVEVNKAAYDSCSISNAIATHTTGNDVISLNRTGTRYFICGFPSHCSSGMKVQIDVVSGATSMPPAGAPGASPPPPSTPSGGNSAATKATATGFGLAAVMLAAGLMA